MQQRSALAVSPLVAARAVGAAAVPEPSSIVLLGSAFAGVLMTLRRVRG